jgi:hypothetical protein
MLVLVEMRLFSISVNISPLHTHMHIVCVREVLQQPCEAEACTADLSASLAVRTEEGPEHREQWTKAGTQLRVWKAMHSKL